MRRTFTLQLGDGGEAHFHRCEMCYRDKPCGYIDCREPRIDTCEECIHSHDCPRCGAQMELTWDSDYLDEHGNETRTNFAATCTCGAVACFVDLHDGRGPLRKQIEPRVGPEPPVHFHRCRCGTITCCDDASGCIVVHMANGGRCGADTERCGGCDPTIKTAQVQRASKDGVLYYANLLSTEDEA